MSRGGAKRRFRVRRRRREGSVATDLGEAVGGEVVAELGCCLIEAVGGLTILVGMLLVPTFLLMS